MGSNSRRYIVKSHGALPDTSHTSLVSAYKEVTRLHEMGAVGVEVEMVSRRLPINLLASPS